MKLIMAVIAVLCLSACASNQTGCHTPDNFTLDAVVRVNDGESNNASGVIIDQNRILTVAHALTDSPAPTVEILGQTIAAEVIAVDESLDLALLVANTNSVRAIPISDLTMDHGDMVWAIGYPLAQEQRISIGQYQNENSSSLYASAHINSGTSGGGLLQCRAGNYSLAGIVRAYVALRQKDQQLVNTGDSVSVPALAIHGFLQRIDNKALVAYHPYQRRFR